MAYRVRTAWLLSLILILVTACTDEEPDSLSLRPENASDLSTPTLGAPSPDPASPTATDTSVPPAAETTEATGDPTGVVTDSTASLSSPEPAPSSEPASITTELAGTSLGLTDAHGVIGEWEEDRYEVVDRSDVEGLGVPVTSTIQSSSVQLEYRLANRFSTLSLTVAQANNSQDSNQDLTVRVLGNEEQIGIQKVAFNKVGRLELDITGVNALKLRLYLDEDKQRELGGGSASVIAVVEDLQVQ